MRQRDRGEERICPSLILFYQGPQWLEWSPLTLVRVHLLTQPIDSNAYFVQKCPQRNTQKYFHQLSGNFLAQSSQRVKLSHQELFSVKRNFRRISRANIHGFQQQFSLNERGEKATHLSGFQISTFCILNILNPFCTSSWSS